MNCGTPKLNTTMMRNNYKSLYLFTDETNAKTQYCYKKCGFEIVDTVIQTMSNNANVNRCKMRVDLLCELMLSMLLKLIRSR